MTWRPTELQPVGLIKPIYSWEHRSTDSQSDGLKAYCYLSQHKLTGEDCYRLRITRPVEGGDAIIDDSHLPWGILQGLSRLPHPSMAEVFRENQRERYEINQFVRVLRDREGWREEQRQEQELITSLIGAAIKCSDRLPNDDPHKQSVKGAIANLQQFWRQIWGGDQVLVVDALERSEPAEQLKSLSSENVREGSDEPAN